MATPQLSDAHSNLYYPPRQKVGDLHEDFRRLYDHMYAQQRRNDELEARLKDMTDKHAKLSAQVAGGPSTTKIAGLYVIGTQPSDGQKLTYKAASGQIEWA